MSGLLQVGNSKLGEAIATWSLPLSSCIGASGICRKACYANRGRFRFQRVVDKFQWNYEQTLQPDFAKRMITEIKSRGFPVVRVHVSGDYYSAEYAEKWFAITRACKAKIYWYTRSWRDADVFKVLARIAKLKNARGWFSVDSETGQPSTIPNGIRIAYLEMDATKERPSGVSLVFRPRKVRQQKIGLKLVCPAELPKGESNCGSCGNCWQ